MKLFNAILLAASFFAVPALAAEKCVTPADVHAANAKFKAERFPDLTESEIDGKDAQRLRDLFTKLNGAESVEVDSFLVASLGTSVAVAVVKDGCVVVHFSAPADEWLDYVEESKGNRS